MANGQFVGRGYAVPHYDARTMISLHGILLSFQSSIASMSLEEDVCIENHSADSGGTYEKAVVPICPPLLVHYLGLSLILIVNRWYQLTSGTGRQHGMASSFSPLYTCSHMTPGFATNSVAWYPSKWATKQSTQRTPYTQPG